MVQKTRGNKIKLERGNCYEKIRYDLIEKEELLYEYAKNYVPKKEINDDENLIKNKIERLKEEHKELETKIMKLFDDHNENKIPTVIYEKYSKEYTL